MILNDFQKKKKQLPDAPGVYFFLGPKREVLYIGKATSLRDRVRSYFSPDLASARSPLVVQMVEKARSIDWRETDSVLEALILESSLIKTHKPHHNTLEKDDKSFNYVIITDETFPRVLVKRGKELGGLPPLPSRGEGGGEGCRSNPSEPFKATFGPFPHGVQLKEAMKIIRKIFPFRDKCNPPHPNPLPGRGEGAARARPCFNRQIGLCPGVCSGEVSAAEYGRTIRHIMLFLGGHKKKLLTTLESEMKKAARSERFEEAARLRGQMFALQHIQDVSLIKDDYRNFSARDASGLMRIEAYDTAHWQGSAAVGVMVAVENGEAVPAEYRTFGIKAAGAGDDIGALREILSRRLAHDEWRLPRLIVADGGKAQLAAAQKTLEEAGFHIPVVAVVKDDRHKARGILGNPELIKIYEKEILLANAEAHRFSIAKHRNKRRIG